MRERIHGTRVECAERKAKNVILAFYDEHPELMQQRKKESIERQKTINIKPKRFNSFESLHTILPNPVAYIGKCYLMFGKKVTISSVKEAKIIIEENITVY